jgi:redox-sensitive bicupin YhaK (pirin superfamily)
MSVILGARPLGWVWDTLDPFLFCVHHDDAYPAGDSRMAPAASLAGRAIGQDFAGLDGWRMYHGRTIPGFPAHPHRGFETITILRDGFCDHSDSLGATARFGRGDVQWMTAGRGVVHAEMFPLREQTRPNPLELFQIWINLPAAQKMCEPHFTMLWAPTVPRRTFHDAHGHAIDVTVVAGTLGDAVAPKPPPRSWASVADSHVAIWTITLAPGARWTVPAGPRDANRMLYVYRGAVDVDGRRTVPKTGLRVQPGAAIPLLNGDAPSELLMLQGRPIGEPVSAQGPFVMNTPEEIAQAYQDYQRTRFGGWPWSRPDPAHPREEGRFARHADGRVERPTG